MRFHRSALHSFIGGIFLAIVVASVFATMDRQRKPASDNRPPTPPVKFSYAIFICALGITCHLLLDFFSGRGMQLLWPIRSRWFGVSLTGELDPWVLALFVLGTLLPLLFGLVHEEIGARAKKSPSRAWPIATLAVFAAYLGWRVDLRAGALSLLRANEFHGLPVNSALALPYSNTPLTWFGVVRTDNTFETVEIPAIRESDFDSNRSTVYFPQQGSSSLNAAQETPAARAFMNYARVPFSEVEETQDGYEIQMRDLAYDRGDTSNSNILLRIQLDKNLQLTSYAFRFASAKNP